LVHRYYDRTLDSATANPFRSEGYLRNGAVPRQGGGAVELQSLPPFLRALLVTDGTVTKILEAYFWEPVEVQTLRQELVETERPIDWIDLDAGAPVLVRHAQLRGTDSDLVFATAFSVIRTERIPPAFRRRLVDREIGIGVLIRDSGMESYREVLEIGVEAAEDGHGGELVFRTYRIIINREPVILITESFPVELYR
jgi:chorismate-pyruvate lyase